MEPTNLTSSSYKPQTTKPEKKEMLEFLCPISAKWYEVGDSLGVDSNTMEGLCNSNFSNEVKLSKVLQRRLEKAEAESTSVTWDEIIHVKSLVTNKPSMYFDLYHVSIVNIHILQTMNGLHYLQSYGFPYSEIEFSILVPCRHFSVIIQIVCDVMPRTPKVESKHHPLYSV